MREVVRAGDRTRGAIAGRRAAEIYGGVILQEHLEDNRENYTRFLLLSPSSAEPENSDKLSLVFQLDHRPRALYYALEPFARRNVNLMKIESRPVHGSPGNTASIWTCRRRGATRKWPRRCSNWKSWSSSCGFSGRMYPRRDRTAAKVCSADLRGPEK